MKEAPEVTIKAPRHWLAVVVWTRNSVENERLIALYDPDTVLKVLRKLERASAKAQVGVFQEIYPGYVIAPTKDINDAIPLGDTGLMLIGEDTLELIEHAIEAEAEVNNYIEEPIGFASLLYYPKGNIEFYLEQKHWSGVMTGFYSADELLEALKGDRAS